MMQPEWKGSQPQRFSGGRRTIQPQGQLALGFAFNAAKQYPPSGLRSFSQSPTPEAVYKPHLRTYQQQYRTTPKQIDYRGVKHIQVAQPPQRIRAEKAHIPGGQETNDQLAWRGIKSYEEANMQSKNRFTIQEQMQRKRKLNGLQTLRNNIGLTSMGDKSYKYPQYASNFYQSGGLIPGSTHKLRKNEEVIQIKKGSVFTKPNWDVKVKMDEALEQKKILDSIDNWQQTTLKQNNPKWNDPDTFFERQQPKQQGKDNKKAAKK